MFYVNEDKLNGVIAEKRTTKEALADSIGIDRSTFYRRLKNNALLVRDVHAICSTLHLNAEQAREIFLAQ